MEPVTITLAGAPYTIAPLELGQIEDIGFASALPDTGDPQEDMRRGFRRAREIVAAALSRDYPEMTAEKLRTLAVAKGEMSAAVSAVFDLSGLVPKGEATPPAAGASTGTGSTEGSPPG